MDKLSLCNQKNEVYINYRTKSDISLWILTFISLGQSAGLTTENILNMQISKPFLFIHKLKLKYLIKVDFVLMIPHMRRNQWDCLASMIRSRGWGWMERTESEISFHLVQTNLKWAFVFSINKETFNFRKRKLCFRIRGRDIVEGKHYCSLLVRM